MQKSKFLLIQGRALPQTDNSIQNFPENWKKEFPIINNLGFDGIEWIYNKKSETTNPLLSSDGRKEMVELSSQYDVKLESIVLDWFLSYPLLVHDELSIDKKMDKLIHLINCSEEIGFKRITLPMLEKNEINSKNQKNAFKNVFEKDVLPYLDSKNIEIHLETSLSPNEENLLLNEINHEQIKICFDMGNSTCFGFEPTEVISTIGNHLGSVHIKDRMLNGPSVPLGKGSVDFYTVFKNLKKINFSGPYSFEVYRDRKLDNVQVIKNSLSFINNIISKM